MLPPRGCVAVLSCEEVADVDDPTEAVRRPGPVEEEMELSGAGGAAAGAYEKTMKRCERNSVNTSRRLKTKIKASYQNKGREKNRQEPDFTKHIQATETRGTRI